MEMRSLEKTAKALDAWDAAVKDGVRGLALDPIARACAKAFAEETKDINDPETILGLFHAAPPPFIRAMVALWRYPEQVARLKELTKKLDAYSGLTHYWYEINVQWAKETGALTPEEGAEYGRLVRWVGLAVGQNVLAH
jgi:hypothetical protein